jgi:hypothetical protein
MTSVDFAKRLFFALVFTALGVGIGALLYWELTLGFAAGKYGGASRADTPGLFWFFMVMQAAMGLAMFRSAVIALMPGIRPATNRLVLAGLALVVLLGAWAVVDLARLGYSLIMQVQGTDRWLYGGLFAVNVGVFATLIYNFFGEELRQRVVKLWRR